jgi:hypothetical protein
MGRCIVLMKKSHHSPKIWSSWKAFAMACVTQVEIMSFGSWNFVSNFNLLKYSYFNIRRAKFSFWSFRLLLSSCFALCFRELLEAQSHLPVSCFKTSGSCNILPKFLSTLCIFSSSETLTKQQTNKFFCHVFNHEATNRCCQLLRNKSVLLLTFRLCMSTTFIKLLVGRLQ